MMDPVLHMLSKWHLQAALLMLLALRFMSRLSHVVTPLHAMEANAYHVGNAA
jgi:hypothetical protein